MSAFDAAEVLPDDLLERFRERAVVHDRENTFPSDDGAVLTAESEGFVKRFDKNGKFVELAAHATLSGGCKNVAVATSKDGKKIYLMDLPGSRFLIFERKAPASVAANWTEHQGDRR